MIPASRPVGAGPEILHKTFPSSGKSERELVIEAVEQHIAGGGLPEKFSYEFKRYRHASVREALERMFHKKCAYCEQRYVALQPMDVEHWRPKGGAEHGDGFAPNGLGYYWLASEWSNLLPSCIDCNRGRNLFDIDNPATPMLLGKANQFPLEAGTAPATDPHDTQLLDDERPLLLNPCDPTFDPKTEFFYTDDAVMRGLTPIARVSIRVYALNRVDLVAERMAVRKIYEHRLAVIHDVNDLLARSRRDRQPLDVDRALVENMHQKERDALLEMAQSASPFAGMIRFYLRSDTPGLATGT